MSGSAASMMVLSGCGLSRIVLLAACVTLCALFAREPLGGGGSLTVSGPIPLDAGAWVGADASDVAASEETQRGFLKAPR